MGVASDLWWRLLLHLILMIYLSQQRKNNRLDKIITHLIIVYSVVVSEGTVL
jgi:hypothetical protein